MSYQVTPTALPEVLLLAPQVFHDARGFLFESFNQREWTRATGLSATFVQDNHSQSHRHVLRGLHYQLEHAQGKLVRAVHGEIFDVAVDLRRSSPRFGAWVGVHLSADNHHQLWIPPGFAHGFLCLSDTADVLYKTTDYWYPEHERAVLWCDPQLAVRWPLQGTPVLSEKDVQAPVLAQAQVYV